MVTRILKSIYLMFPSSLVNRIGRSTLLMPLRRRILNVGNERRLMTVKAHWGGKSFFYTGHIKSAIKAERNGIESSLLRLSMRLLMDIKKKDNNAIVLDIGSSYGFLSTVWALTVSSNGHVYGFEANQSVCQTAMNTAFKNNLDNRIDYNHYAVYESNGSILMSMHAGTHASLSENNRTTRVRTITIDSFCSMRNLMSIDLIKVDVDGPEWQVIQGAQGIILRDKPILIIESNNDKRIIDYLKEINYSIFDLMMNKWTDGKPIPPNIVGIPIQLISELNVE